MLIRLLGLLLPVVFLCSCALTRVQARQALDTFESGKTTREQVADALGNPHAESQEENAWIYLYEEEVYLARDVQVFDAYTLSVYFDEDDLYAGSHEAVRNMGTSGDDLRAALGILQIIAFYSLVIVIDLYDLLTNIVAN